MVFMEPFIRKCRSGGWLPWQTVVLQGSWRSLGKLLCSLHAGTHKTVVRIRTEILGVANEGWSSESLSLQSLSQLKF